MRTRFSKSGNRPIPNCLPPRSLQHSVNRSEPVWAFAATVTCTAVCSLRKGLDQLLDAWTEFANSLNTEVTLLIVGDGPEGSHLLRRTQDAALQNVRFLKHFERTELPPIYQAADVFVLPTLHECWALVFEEALASGLPVINSIYNGSAERIVEGETGWLVDPLDHVDFVRKLQMAWEARDRHAEMSQAAGKASAKMSIPAAAERFRRVVKLAVQNSQQLPVPPQING